jgi:hypothetical protein
MAASPSGALSGQVREQHPEAHPGYPLHLIGHGGKAGRLRWQLGQGEVV